MIREATEKDVTYILDIYNDVILNTTAVYAYKPVTLKNRIDWYKQKKADGYPIFVYELDNKVVGFTTFGPFRAWPAYKYSIEHSAYVNKEYRNRGIGTSLMKELIAIAREREYMTLIAGIDAENEKSIALHETMDLFMQGRLKRLVTSLING